MDQNIIEKEPSISSLATLLSNLTLKSIFYIWIVAYIIQFILNMLFIPLHKILYKLTFTDSQIYYFANIGSTYVISALFSFMSLYITLKYFLPYLQLSNEKKTVTEIACNRIDEKKVVNEIESNQVNEKKLVIEIAWGRVRVLAIWAIPFINLIPMFFIYLGLAMSSARGELGLYGLLIGATLPFIGLIIAFLHYRNSKSFSLFSIITIPALLCFFEVYLVFKVFETH